MSFCVGLKSACWCCKCCSKDDDRTKNLSANDFRNSIYQIFKDIEDPTLTDDKIIETLHNLNISKQQRLKLKEIRFGADDYSLLHSAAKVCRAKLCTCLIDEFKIDRDLLSGIKSTPLQVLVKFNVVPKANSQLEQDPSYANKRIQFTDTFNVLIDRHANINHQDNIGYTVLHYAVQKSNYEATRLILSNSNINVNIEDAKYMTPLHLACKNASDRDETINLLVESTDVEKICNYKTVNTTPIHLLCRNKEEKLEMVDKMLEKLRDGSSPGKNYVEYVLKKEDLTKQTIAHIAMSNSHTNIIELLFSKYELDREIKDGKMGYYLIHTAAKNGSTKMIDLLEKHDAVSFKTNNNQENALHVAAEYNSSQFIKEFLKLEQDILNNPESDRYMMCMCRCNVPCSNTTISIRTKNKDLYTPLMSALAFGNQKCVEELMSSRDIELDCKDIEGNSIYHIIAKFNNTESLKYFLAKHFDATREILFSKNNFDETVFHIACRFGHLEIIKMILNKLNNTNYSSILNSKNLQGQTCIHIACAKGYHNIVEYFLRDRKFLSFLEHLDNESNTCLHLACEHGQSSIVGLLLEFDCDLDAKNEQNLTPLDLSCRNGFFEISKMLIQKYSKITDSQTPLHAAAAEGAHEVVRLLLEKGATIDKLDEKNQNCLDIAISKGHREVVKVLLEDPNWDRLIRFNNFEDENVTLTVVTNNKSDEETVANPVEKANKEEENLIRRNIKQTENPEIFAMFEHKMWDSIRIVLDRCVHPKYVDFTKIDMPLSSMSKHPLMLIALSGQENLLKHKTTLTLLDLKWRFIPRFMYNFNMLYYILFLVLLSIYSIELANVGVEFSNEIINSQDDPENFPPNTTLNLNDYANDLTYYTNNSLLFSALMLMIILSLIKEAFQLLVLEGFSYFTSLQNIAELLTYSLAISSLLSYNYSLKAAYGSLSILFAFLVFPLYIQKLKVFGVYVVAFIRTLSNSAKFLPIFLIIFIGFMFAFKIRSNFGVSYFETTLYSLIRTFTMVSGELDTEKMGLHDNYGSIPNYIIYILFIGLMCTILLNLFVGIAVGEIKTVLDEADLQQISMRIMFVLKVQSSINPFKRTFVGKYLNMTYTRYFPDEENSLYKILGVGFKRFLNMFKSKQPEINLMDPHKRLEDQLMVMNKQTNEQIKSIKSLFNNQVSDVETKLNNSQIKIEDGLNEIARNTNSYFDNLLDQFSTNSKNIHQKIESNDKKFEQGLANLNTSLMSEFHYSKVFIDDKIATIEGKLDKLISSSFQKTNNYLEIINQNFNKQFNEFDKFLQKFEQRMSQDVNESVKTMNSGFKGLKSDSLDIMRFQLNQFQYDLRALHEELMNVKRILVAITKP